MTVYSLLRYLNTQVVKPWVIQSSLLTVTIPWNTIEQNFIVVLLRDLSILNLVLLAVKELRPKFFLN